MAFLQDIYSLSSDCGLCYKYLCIQVPLPSQASDKFNLVLDKQLPATSLWINPNQTTVVKLLIASERSIFNTTSRRCALFLNKFKSFKSPHNYYKERNTTAGAQKGCVTRRQISSSVCNKSISTLHSSKGWEIYVNTWRRERNNIYTPQRSENIQVWINRQPPK